MNRSYVVAPLLFVTCCLLSAAFAQQNQPAPSSPQTTSPALPSDPAALLQLASQVNGLHGADLQPWHVHATWQTLEKGGVKDQGTYEEWWAGSKQFKITYAMDTYQQTVYVTEHGAFLSGSSEMPNLLFGRVAEIVLSGVPDVESINRQKWRMRHQRDGNVALTCAAQATSEYCFADNLAALRLYANPTENVTLNSIVKFQGRYVAQSIRSHREGDPEMDVRIEKLEILQKPFDSAFTPPESASPVADHPVLVHDPVKGDQRFSGRPPEYPSMAKAMHIQGTVALDATILQDGSVGQVTAIGGPPMLQGAAIKAVRSWRYRPYTLAGQPIMLRTQIVVTFALNPHFGPP